MFQHFDDRTQKSESARRLARLRAELAARGLDGFLVPRSDEYQGEYVAPYAERLSWLTGFSGSAGLAVVLKERAAIFVDGRYTVQVREQVDTGLFEPLDLIAEPPADWLARTLKKGDRLGFDPWLITTGAAEKFRTACNTAGASLEGVSDNPVDAIWADQPGRPAAEVVSHPRQFAGRSAADKLAAIAAAIDSKGAGAAILTMPDSIAWLFNIRGADITHVPVALAYALVARRRHRQPVHRRRSIRRRGACRPARGCERCPAFGFRLHAHRISRVAAAPSFSIRPAPPRRRAPSFWQPAARW